MAFFLSLAQGQALGPSWVFPVGSTAHPFVWLNDFALFTFCWNSLSSWEIIPDVPLSGTVIISLCTTSRTVRCAFQRAISPLNQECDPKGRKFCPQHRALSSESGQCLATLTDSKRLLNEWTWLSMSPTHIINGSREQTNFYKGLPGKCVIHQNELAGM